MHGRTKCVAGPDADTERHLRSAAKREASPRHPGIAFGDAGAGGADDAAGLGGQPREHLALAAGGGPSGGGGRAPAVVPPAALELARACITRDGQ